MERRRIEVGLELMRVTIIIRSIPPLGAQRNLGIRIRILRLSQVIDTPTPNLKVLLEHQLAQTAFTKPEAAQKEYAHSDSSLPVRPWSSCAQASAGQQQPFQPSLQQLVAASADA